MYVSCLHMSPSNHFCNVTFSVGKWRKRPCLGPAQVFRATHGLPPCDDESYDPYGPYGDVGDVETDEVLALDPFHPKIDSFVYQAISPVGSNRDQPSLV